MITNLNQEEKDFLENLVKELRAKKATCRRYCGTYDTIDRDCEIYGNYHPSPSRCKYYLCHRLADFRKEKERGKNDKSNS